MTFVLIYFCFNAFGNNKLLLNSIEKRTAEYSKIANDSITESELKKAKAQISSDISFSRDGAYAIAGALNEALAIGDWKFYTNFIENINNVSAKDVQSIVKKYLVEDQSTVGWFIPKK